jgi:xanthine dehydrogenase YagT iron-sulfur-binding subunit
VAVPVVATGSFCYSCLDFLSFYYEYPVLIFEGTKGRLAVRIKKDPEVPKKPKGSVSRRGFIRGVGIGGAIGTGILEKEAPAAETAGQFVGPGAVAVTLKINGKPYNMNLEPRVTLLDAMRNHLDLTGAKRVCDRATCGACTVIVDGKVMYSCTVLAIDAQGKDIQTIEGIAGATLHPVSAAFVKHDAQQCGYCTPGFVMAAKGFLDKHPNPTLEQCERGLSGNLCRCGTYVGMKKAVLEASTHMKGGSRG